MQIPNLGRLLNLWFPPISVIGGAIAYIVAARYAGLPAEEAIAFTAIFNFAMIGGAIVIAVRTSNRDELPILAGKLETDQYSVVVVTLTGIFGVSIFIAIVKISIPIAIAFGFFWVGAMLFGAGWVDGDRHQMDIGMIARPWFFQALLPAIAPVIAFFAARDLPPGIIVFLNYDVAGLVALIVPLILYMIFTHDVPKTNSR